MRTALTSTHATSAGFTLIEMMMTIAIMCIVAGMTVAGFHHALTDVRGSANARLVAGQLDQARELAINQRRTIEVRFSPPNQIQLVRREIPAGETVVSAVTFENNVEFAQFAGVPDTPDGFGNAAAVDFGDATEVMFLSDGTLADQAGQPISGTVFVGIPYQVASARAVTVFGSTGRVQRYRWDGTAWNR